MAETGHDVLQLRAALAQAQIVERGMLPHVAARIFNAPLAVAAPKLQAILAGLGPRLGLHGVQAEVRGVIRQDRSRDYQVIEGVAVVPVMGTVVKRNASGVLESSGAVSAEALQETILQALTASDVRAILLQVDSYGGEVSGTADLAAFIYGNRSAKRIWAMVDESAYSAAYWIASAAERVIVTQNGGTGSIGVIAIHVDQSKANEQEGLDVSLVIAGERKADLSPFAPLSDRGRATLQAEVDRVWGLFTAAVGKQRGLDPKTLRGFQAACFQGSDGVDAKLADEVGTFDDTLLELATRPTGAQVAVPGSGLTDPDDEHDEPDEDDLPGHARGAREEETMGKETPERPAGGAEVIPLAKHQEETAAARLEARDTERRRQTAIADMATVAKRMGVPEGDVKKHADRLAASDTSEEDIRKTFIDLMAKHGDEDPIQGRTHATPDRPTALKLRPAQESINEYARHMGHRTGLTPATGGAR